MTVATSTPACRHRSTTARADGLLKALVTGDVGRAGINLHARDELGRLALATFSAIDVAVPGAKWVWPKRIEGLQPGQSMLVYADLAEDQPFKVILSGGTDATIEPTVAKAARPLPLAQTIRDHHAAGE